MKAVIINDTSIEENHPGCFSVMSVINIELHKRAITPIGFLPVGKNWIQFENELRDPEIDIFVVNGEGSIHGSQTRPRAKWLSEFATFAKDDLKKPAILINATISNMEKNDILHLKNYTKIYVREKNSQEYLRENEICSEVVPDLSFFMIPFIENNQPEKGNISFSDSVIPEKKDLLKGMSKAYNGNYLPMAPENNSKKGIVQKIKRRLFKTKEIKKHFLNNKITDCEGFGAFSESIKSSKILITGRLHAATLAISQKVPVLCLSSNTGKISWVLKDIFQEESRVFGEASAIKEILEKGTLNDYLYSEREYKQIESYLNSGKTKKDAMFDFIADTAQNTTRKPT